MKRIQKKQRNWKKIIGCSAITLVLACVFVMGFFAVKTGSIFGMFNYQAPYVETDSEGVPSAVAIPDDKLKVTGQEDYENVLTSDSTKYTGLNSLPAIPEANSAYDKGTKENPLVILEIVPELAQQSLSYFATSKEEGLPFDPLEMSIKLSEDQGQSYLSSVQDNTIDNKHYKKSEWKAQGIKNANLGWLTSAGGIFSGNNFDNLYQIYDYDHTVTDSSNKTNGEDYDFSDAPLVVVDSYYTVNMEKGKSFLESLSKEANGGVSYPTIASLYDNNTEFKNDFVDKDGKEIPREVIENDSNWAWNIEKDSDVSKKFTITVDEPSADFESDYAEVKSGALDLSVFLEKYKEILAKADDDTAVTADDLKKVEAWTLGDAQQRYKGYFVYAGQGNGQVSLDPNNDGRIYYNGGGNAWNYVEKKSELPGNAENIGASGKQRYEVVNSINSAKEGQYVAASFFGRIESSDKLPDIKKGNIFTINYDYEGYKIKFEYVGLKWNDVLKRMLINFKDETDSDDKVIKTADQQYDDYHIKIVTVTPAMINEMDKNDTEDTLDYIERADMYYVSSYNSGKSGTDVDQIRNLTKFFWKYVDPDRETALACSVFENEKSKSFSITLKNATSEFDSDYAKMTSNAMDVKAFLSKHKDVLSNTDDGTTVTDKDFERTSSWKFDCDSKILDYSGYFVCVKNSGEKGNVNMNSSWGASYADQGSWKYVADESQLPANGRNIWPEDKQDWQVSNDVSNAQANDYFPVTRLKTEKIDKKLFNVMNVTKESTYTITYKYAPDPCPKELASFEQNDLEWSDCMKIIKRLSGDAGLAMMFSKQMGFYLDDGTDTVCNLLYDSYYKHNQKGSLCNLAKLYLISTLFDLSASTSSETNKDLIWTFMDNVYGNIQQVKLSSSSKAEDNTAEYTGYFKEAEEGVNAACEADGKDLKYTYLWNLYSFVPYVTTASKDALYKPDGSGDMETFVKKYGFLHSSLIGIYSNEKYGEIGGNISDKGYGTGLSSNNSFNYSSITGTRDPLEDYQNVTIVMPGDMQIVTWKMGQQDKGVPGTFLYKKDGKYSSEESLDNKNFTIIDKGVMSRIAVVLYNILQNAKAPNPTMKFNVDSNEKSKSYYQKMSNSSVLIDFNQMASYNENRSKEKNVLKVFCTLNNSRNNENSIITSIKLVDPNDSSKPAIPVSTIYDTDGNVIQKEQDIGFSQKLPTPKKYSVEKITGYKVTSNNAKYSFSVPFKLSDWKDGYTQIRIDWVARSSKKLKGEFTPYQNPADPNDDALVEAAKQFAEVDIGERELFDLE